MEMNYSEHIAKILDAAKEEAKRINASYAKATQVFVATIQYGDPDIEHLLETLKISKSKLAEIMIEKPIVTLKNSTQDIAFDAKLRAIMEKAKEEAKNAGDTSVKPLHLFLALVSDDGIEKKLKSIGLSQEILKNNAKNVTSNTSRTPYLDQFGEDLVAKAKVGKLDPVFGRFDETERIIKILTRRRKNNPVLFGGPGVGKTAIVEGIAHLIAAGKTPENLKEKRIVELSIHSVIAGASKRGEFEERLKKIIEEVKNTEGSIILFIDEIHSLVSEETAANILKPALARGEIQCIGATTEGEYRKYFKKDAALERRFQPVYITEPSHEDCFTILKGLKNKYETFHHVQIPDEMIEYTITLSDRYIFNQQLPDKALDLLDEACASLTLPETSIPEKIQEERERIQYIKNQIPKAEGNVPLLNTLLIKKKKREEKIQNLEQEYKEIQKQKNNILNPFILENTVSEATNIPLTHIREEEEKRLINIEPMLMQSIVGQNEAVKTVADAIIRNRTGLKKKNRPIGSFIFMGPTGVGKTELAKRLAEYLFGTKNALIRFDMSEFMEKHSSARLIGAPPGYIGYEEGGQLTEMIQTRPYSIILFDEIEKAHPEIFHLLLQILDEGHLSDAKGQKVNFKNTIIICTTNLGGHTIDFAKFESLAQREQKNALIKELQKLLNPELINRFDDIVLFKFLKKEEIKKIVNLLLSETLEALQEKNISLSLNDSAHDKLAEIGFDPIFGARPLRNAIQKEIDNPLSKMILQKEIGEGDQLNCQFDGEKFVFRKMN